MLQRLTSNWVYGGFLAGILLFALAPMVLAGWSAPLAATFLLLPAYMIHQYEEHDHDRFRRFFNEKFCGGFDALTVFAVFIVNVPGVWGLIALSLYCAASFGLGWALFAVYLVLVNAVIHIAHSILFRCYNPGLATAVVLFVPMGAIALVLIDRAGGASVASHAIAFFTAVALHAALVLHVRRTFIAERRRQGVASGARSSSPSAGPIEEVR